MKYLRYITKILVLLFMIALFIFLGLLGVENKKELTYLLFDEHPADGEYWIQFSTDNGESFITVDYVKRIYEYEKYNASNLMIYPEITNYSFTIEKESLNSEAKIRELILQKGGASIIDENIATKEEIAAQDIAKNLEIGCWAPEGEGGYSVYNGQGKDEWTIFDLINGLRNFAQSKLFIIIRWLVGILGIGVIFNLFVKFLRRNNIDIFFCGEISSGKTTMIERLKDPHISRTHLENITSTKGKVVSKPIRVAMEKKDLYLRLVDNPGQEHGKILDSVNKKFFANPHKILLIIVALSPTKEEDSIVNEKYLNDEISKVVQILSIACESSTIKPIEKKIIFINKCDCLYEDEKSMIRDKYKKVKKYLESTYSFEELDNLLDNYGKEIDVVYGSALEGWGIKEVEDIIKGKYKRHIRN